MTDPLEDNVLPNTAPDPQAILDEIEGDPEALEVKRQRVQQSLARMRDQSAIFNTIRMWIADPKITPLKLDLRVRDIMHRYETRHPDSPAPVSTTANLPDVSG